MDWKVFIKWQKEEIHKLNAMYIVIALHDSIEQSIVTAMYKKNYTIIDRERDPVNEVCHDIG